MTSFDGHALHVRHWIGSKAWRTLTNSSVVVSDANRVHSARILVASVVASMRQPVAELSGRTVDVVDARNGAAAFDHVVGVASVESGRTLAVRHVVVNDAESVRSAGNEVADGLTGEKTLLRAPAGLVFGTLAVRGALVLLGRLTTLTIDR